MQFLTTRYDRSGAMRAAWVRLMNSSTQLNSSMLGAVSASWIFAFSGGGA